MEVAKASRTSETAVPNIAAARRKFLGWRSPRNPPTSRPAILIAFMNVKASAAAPREMPTPCSRCTNRWTKTADMTSVFSPLPMPMNQKVKERIASRRVKSSFPPPEGCPRDMVSGTSTWPGGSPSGSSSISSGLRLRSMAAGTPMTHIVMPEAMAAVRHPIVVWIHTMIGTAMMPASENPIVLIAMAMVRLRRNQLFTAAETTNRPAKLVPKPMRMLTA